MTTPKTWDEAVEQILWDMNNATGVNSDDEKLVAEAKSALNNAVKEYVIGSQDKKEYWPVWKKELLERQRKIVNGGK